jgi:hypothetical protein
MDSLPHPSCDDYLNMPVTEAVLEHVRVCDSCRAVLVQLADDLDQRLFEHRHRN